MPIRWISLGIGICALVAGIFLFQVRITPDTEMPLPSSTSTIPSVSVPVSKPNTPITGSIVGTLVKNLPPLEGDIFTLHPVAPSAGGEWTPDLYKQATKEITVSGTWSELFAGIEVSPNDIIRIPPEISVMYDVSDTKTISAIVVQGKFIFDPAKNTKLSVGTIFVSGDGELHIKPANGRSAEIVLNGALDREGDPAELLLGIIAVGGKVVISGNVVSVPFTKVTGEKGSQTISTNQATGWNVGDEIFITASGPADSDPTYWQYNTRDTSKRAPFPQEWEIRRIVAITGTRITLDEPLSYGHNGYVAKLNRSVYIHSDSANKNGARGHVMFAGNVQVTVENTRLKDLGRTTVAFEDNTEFSALGRVIHVGKNEEGRYSLHAHHVSEPIIFSGNVIDGSPGVRTFETGAERMIAGSPKWGIVSHDSSGSIRNNIVIGAAGSGIVGEDGTETGVVEGNLVVGTGGGSGDNDDERFGLTEGDDMAHGGFGYWFRGPFVNVRNNIAAGHFNEAAYLYFLHPQFVRNSLSNRAWIPADIRGKSMNDLVSRSPIREFKGNVAEGFFGNAGFMMFYSLSQNTLENITIRTISGTDVRALATRHSTALKVVDSHIQGGGTGVVFESAPETDAITLSNTTIIGFPE